MKTIKTTAIITGIRSKSDRSLGLSISTPEYSPDESVQVLRLQGMNVMLTIQPMDEKSEETITIDRDAGQKTPSERLRSVLFIMWQAKKDEWPEFDAFYRSRMEKIIDQLKDRL